MARSPWLSPFTTARRPLPSLPCTFSGILLRSPRVFRPSGFLTCRRDETGIDMRDLRFVAALVLLLASGGYGRCDYLTFAFRATDGTGVGTGTFSYDPSMVGTPAGSAGAHYTSFMPSPSQLPVHLSFSSPYGTYSSSPYSQPGGSPFFPGEVQLWNGGMISIRVGPNGYGAGLDLCWNPSLDTNTLPKLIDLSSFHSYTTSGAFYYATKLFAYYDENYVDGNRWFTVTSITPATIPEPSTLLLAGMAVAVSGAYFRWCALTPGGPGRRRRGCARGRLR
jgi:hypothetical protein